MISWDAYPESHRRHQGHSRSYRLQLSPAPSTRDHVEGKTGRAGEAHGGDPRGDGAAEAPLWPAERGAEPARGGAPPGEPGALREVQPAGPGHEGGQRNHRTVAGHQVCFRREGEASPEAQPTTLKDADRTGGPAFTSRTWHVLGNIMNRRDLFQKNEENYVETHLY